MNSIQCSRWLHSLSFYFLKFTFRLMFYEGGFINNLRLLLWLTRIFLLCFEKAPCKKLGLR